MRRLLGTGVLSWMGGERRTDRYGYVMLMPEGTDSMTPANQEPPRDEWPALRLADVVPTEGGRLVAVVTATRKSTHVGDLFLGISPSEPAVGEELVLGQGFFMARAHEGLYHVGLVPEDGRPKHWLDPNVLYRAHEQSVELYFEPDGRSCPPELSDRITPDGSLRRTTPEPNGFSVIVVPTGEQTPCGGYYTQHRFED